MMLSREFFKTTQLTKRLLLLEKTFEEVSHKKIDERISSIVIEENERQGQ